jgi:SecD/SecF fusion protein
MGSRIALVGLVIAASIAFAGCGGDDDGGSDDGPERSEEATCTESPGGDSQQVSFSVSPGPGPPNPTAEQVSDTVEILCRRLHALDVDKALVEASGPNQIDVLLPKQDQDETDRIVSFLDTPARLHFYDWEPNVIPNPNASGSPTESPFPRLYDAVQLASKQAPECDRDQCTTSGRSYYLFAAKSREPISGPKSIERDLFINQPGQAQPPGSEVVTVPQGALVVQAESPPDDPDTDADESGAASDRWFVIRDRPALSSADIVNPEQDLDPVTNRANVVFDFTPRGRAAFAALTRRMVGREPAPHLAIILDQEVASRPAINAAENPEGIDAPGASITGAFSVDDAQRLADFLEIGPLPVNLTPLPAP